MKDQCLPKPGSETVFKNGAVMRDELVSLLSDPNLCVFLFVTKGFVVFKPRIEVSSSCEVALTVLDSRTGEISNSKFVYEEAQYAPLFV